MKEIGVYVTDRTLAEEAYAMLEQFYKLSTTDKEELIDFDKLSEDVRSVYNLFNAENLYPAEYGASYYLSQSPKRMNAPTRSWDADSLVSIIEAANKTVDVQAMDYVPALIYQDPKVYWGKLDDALRAAAFRGVKVRLMVQQTTEDEDLFKSLATVNNVEVYFMAMPNITDANDTNGWDHTRLTHSKFVKADGQSCAITTSNWTGDFFENTAGLTLVAWDDSAICNDLKSVMDRDTSSGFATPL